MKNNVYVVGTGITGCTIARLLAEQGHEVTIFKKPFEKLGGACSDTFISENYEQHHGSHIFHTNNKQVYEFISQFTELLPYQHKVKGLINGDLLPIPVNRTHLKQLNNKMFSQIFTEASELTLKELLDSEDDSLVALGEYVKDNVFKGYSLKQWGHVPSSDVLNRLKAFRNSDDCRYFLDKYQGIPDKGFSQMMLNMLEHQNIIIRESLTSNEYLQSSVLAYYTGSIDELLNYEFGILPYRTCAFVEVGVSARHAQECAVINYPNDYEFTRSHDYSHYMPGSKSAVYLEFPKAWDKHSSTPRYYPIDSLENKQLYNKYKEHLAENYPHIVPAGRLGTYQYMNIDKAIEQAMELIKK